MAIAKYLAIFGDIFGCPTASKIVDSYRGLLVELREVAKYSTIHRLTPKHKKICLQGSIALCFRKAGLNTNSYFLLCLFCKQYLPTETNDKAANHFLRKIIIKNYVTIYEVSLP